MYVGLTRKGGTHHVTTVPGAQTENRQNSNDNKKYPCTKLIKCMKQITACFVRGPWFFREDETQFLQNGVSMTAIIHHQDYLNDG